jgi:uncharacterized membrane protein YhfC
VILTTIALIALNVVVAIWNYKRGHAVLVALNGFALGMLVFSLLSQVLPRGSR